MPSERQTYAHDPISSAFLFDQAQRVPSNAFEALMEAAPGDEPVESWDEKQERLEPLRDALESGLLTDRQVWVIEALYWRRIGLRSVAAELSLSKTQVARIRDAALVVLRDKLEGAFL